MEFFKIAGIILVCILLAGCLPALDKSVSALISICVCFCILGYIVNITSPVIENIKSVFSNTNGDFTLIFKTMGISFVTQFVSDVAADNGNKALANQMIFAGKTAIVILALPVFMQVLEIIGQIIQ